MTKGSYTRRIGGLIILLICLSAIFLVRIHNVYLGILFLCVDLAGLAIYAFMLRRHA